MGEVVPCEFELNGILNYLLVKSVFKCFVKMLFVHCTHAVETKFSVFQTMAVPPDISTLRCWLKDVLGEEPPDWEVTTTTQCILEELYLTHQRQEAAAALELEELQEARAEYQAETARLSHILSKLGGLEEQMTSGLAGSYLNTLSEVAFTLNLDLAPGSTTCAVSMQAALARLLIKQVRNILWNEWWFLD